MWAGSGPRLPANKHLEELGPHLREVCLRRPWGSWTPREDSCKHLVLLRGDPLPSRSYLVSLVCKPAPHASCQTALPYHKGTPVLAPQATAVVEMKPPSTPWLLLALGLLRPQSQTARSMGQKAKWAASLRGCAQLDFHHSSPRGATPGTHLGPCASELSPAAENLPK